MNKKLKTALSRVKNRLIPFYIVLVLGLVGFSLLTYVPQSGPAWGAMAFLCFVLIMLVFLMEQVLAWKGMKRTETVSNILTLLRLFRGALVPRKAQNLTNVKGYYTTEQYDWITDSKFPERILHDRRYTNTTRRALEYIKGSEVLDLGCGTGLITRALPGSVTGVDIGSWKIERARQHCPHAFFLEGDVEDLSALLSDNSFDAVVCTDVLEHLEAPHKAVAEAWRVLKNKGLFIGTVPSKSIVWKFRRFLTTANTSGEPFHNYYSKRQVRRLLEPFEVLETTHQSLGLEVFFAARKVQ